MATELTPGGVDEEYNFDDIDAGFGIGGRCINNLRYADDTTLLAESIKGLMKLAADSEAGK